MRTFIGPDIIFSDLTECPTLFAQSELKIHLHTIKRAGPALTIVGPYAKN